MSASPVRLYYHPTALGLAQLWRSRCELIEACQPPGDQPGFFLWLADGHVELRCGGRRGAAWVRCAELRRRAAQRGDLLRACGVAGGHRPSVLDAMAGWGVDGLVLARHGCRVTLVEREPALCVLAQDLLRRCGPTGVGCRCADAAAVLDEATAWDVVYLDPMFAPRSKAALPGKRMQWLAELSGNDPQPLSTWIERAVRRARERVVLKRRRKDPLTGIPDWRIVGRTVRYDVYRGAAADP